MTHPPLLVFADDWGRHPSSCQHLVRRLLDHRSVVWVNTIGTRPPRLDLATLRRGFGKLRQWLRPAGGRAAGLTPADPANLRVLNPRMWPWFTRPLDRRLNRRLLLRQLAPVVRSLPALPVAVTTLPIIADLMDDLPVRQWVYYCVDDFSQWPGLDQTTLRNLEEQVVRRADMVIAVSENLQERLAGMSREAPLLTHGVDLDFWAIPRTEEAILELDGLERPLVVFWGVVDRRMDVALVRHLGDCLERGTIVLAGPEADPDPTLARCRRVVRLGSLPFDALPNLAHEAAVLVMPYADLPVTRAMQPLKLKEYLATGRPVVVRDLPANRAWADCLDLADSPSGFTEAVRLRLRTGLPEEQRVARRRLAEESWEGKAEQFERWLIGEGAVRNGVSCA